MKHLTAVLFLSLATAAAWAQTQGSEKQESKTRRDGARCEPGPHDSARPQRHRDDPQLERRDAGRPGKAAKEAEEAKKAQEQPAAAAGKRKKEAAATKASTAQGPHRPGLHLRPERRESRIRR